MTDQQAELTGPTGTGFGDSIAISGSTLVGTEGGSAYVFVRSGTTWSQQAALTTAGGGDFGVSVAVAGSTVVVGAPFPQNTQNGAAFVFVRSGTT